MKDLRVRPIKLDYDQAKSFLSSSMAEMIGDGRATIFSATDEKAELAYVIYAADYKKKNIIHLLWYGAAAELEDPMEYIRIAIDESKKMLFDAGAKEIRAKLLVDQQKGNDPKKMMLKLSFLPLSLHGLMMCYGLNQLLQSDAMLKMTECREKYPKTEPFPKGEAGIEKFRRILRRIDRELDMETLKLCPEVSRLCEKNGREIALLPAILLAEDTCFYPWIYTDPEMKGLQKQIPFMICDSILEAQNILPNNGKLCFQVFDVKLIDAMLKLLGDCESYIEIQEYVCMKEYKYNGK